MKGLLLIILFYLANPLFTFGGNSHSNNGGHNPKEFTFTNPESHTQLDGIFDEEEFYKLGHEEKKHIKTESSAVDTNSIKRVTTVSIRETLQKSSDRSYLFKIGVLRL